MEQDGDHRGHRTHAGLFLVAIVRVCVCVIFTFFHLLKRCPSPFLCECVCIKGFSDGQN
ncbi:Uncharacterized protein APZ42_024649 [Daphnia magna]|uniref:Uncharacterized protein n=1 Tax=Daphnia magna TaxID=35525 RepID=A0A0P5UYT9_9CRUS|nr:Uncharacterized protein APZ42_024649 [Daphnia magna]